MDEKNINLHLSRILSGYYIFLYDNKRYKLKYPNIDIKYEADILFQEEYNKLRFSDWPTKESIVNNLIELGIWTYDGDNKLKSLEKQTEDLKVELFKNFLNPSKIKSIRRNLSNVENSYNNLFLKRHSFDHITIEGYCENIKNQFLLIHSIHNDKNELFLLNNNDSILFMSLCSKISENNISIADFKKIARSSLWRNYWSANKNNILGKPTIEWTDEQKTLVVLTKMYDSAYENPECPPDSIFEDDDMFDGWMILQRRENEKNKNKNRIEKALPGKMNKANEIFIVANSKEEAKDIYNLNDTEGMHIIKERESFLRNKNNNVKEAELPDVQRNIIIQSNENRKQIRKK